MITDNPINIFSLTFKDRELQERYKLIARTLVYNRAKVYSIVLTCFLLLTPYNLIFSKGTFYYFAGLVLATLVPTLIMLVLARYRLFFIDYLALFTMITRDCIGVLLRAKLMHLEACLHPALIVGMNYLGAVLSISDLFLFRSNWLTFILTIPVFVVFSIIKDI